MPGVLFLDEGSRPLFVTLASLATMPRADRIVVFSDDPKMRVEFESLGITVVSPELCHSHDQWWAQHERSLLISLPEEKNEACGTAQAVFAMTNNKTILPDSVLTAFNEALVIVKYSGIYAGQVILRIMPGLGVASFLHAWCRSLQPLGLRN